MKFIGDPAKSLLTRSYQSITGEMVGAEAESIKHIAQNDTACKRIEYLYEELNIIDRKMTQAALFNSGIIISSGILYRMLPTLGDLRDSGWIEQSAGYIGSDTAFILLVILFALLISVLISSVSALVCSCPGLVSVGTMVKRGTTDGQEETYDKAIDDAIWGLVKVRLTRSRRYHKMLTFTILSFAMIFLSIMLCIMLQFVVYSGV